MKSTFWALLLTGIGIVSVATAGWGHHGYDPYWSSTPMGSYGGGYSPVGYYGGGSGGGYYGGSCAGSYGGNCGGYNAGYYGGSCAGASYGGNCGGYGHHHHHHNGCADFDDDCDD